MLCPYCKEEIKTEGHACPCVKYTISDATNTVIVLSQLSLVPDLLTRIEKLETENDKLQAENERLEKILKEAKIHLGSAETLYNSIKELESKGE